MLGKIAHSKGARCQRQLKLGVVASAVLVAALAAPALARGSRRGASRYETVELAALRSNPKAFIGKPISFDCFFAQLGSIHQPFQTPFVVEQFLNFHVWEPGTELWDNKARKNAFLFCYIPRDLEKQTNYIMKRRMYESVRLLGQVRVVYTDQPWFEVDGVAPSPMPSIDETALKHILVGIKSLRNGDFPMAQESFEEALREGLPISVQTFAQRELGKAYYELEKYAEAAEALKKASAIARNDAQVLLRWGQSLSRAADLEKLTKKATGMLRDGISHLDKARKLEPANPDMHAEIGWVKAKQARLERRDELIQEALRDVRRALALSATAPSYDILARIYIQIGKLAEAENALSQAEARDPRNPKYHRAMAKLVYMPQERYADAEREFANVIKVTPTEPYGYIDRAEARRKQRDFDGAIEDYESAHHADPENLPALLGLASVYRDQDNYDNARNFLRKALKLAPRNVKVLVAYAEILEAQEQYDDAIVECEKIRKMKLKGPLTNVDYLQGKCLAEKPRPDFNRAVTLLAKVVKAEPGHVEARKALAKAYAGKGQFSRAVTELEAVKKLRPGDEASRLLLGHVRAESGNANAAMAEFRGLLEANPENAYAKNYLAYLLVGKDLEGAHELAKQANEADATNPTFQDTLGWIKFKMGNSADARVLLEMATGSDPEEPEPYYHLAVLTQDEDVAVARENLEEALRRLNEKTSTGVLTQQLKNDALKLARKLKVSTKPKPRQPSP